MDFIMFQDIEDLVSCIVEYYESVIDACVSIVACDYHEAKEILQELLTYHYEIGNIELCDEMWSGYDKEFVISLYNGEISVEKAMSEDGTYLNGDDDIVFISSNANSKVVNAYKKSDEIIEFLFEDDEDDYCCGDCEHCCHRDDKDDNLTVVINGRKLGGNDKYEALEEALYRFNRAFRSFDRFTF